MGVIKRREGGQYRASIKPTSSPEQVEGYLPGGGGANAWHLRPCLHPQRDFGGSVKSPIKMQILAAGSNWRTLKG